MKYLTVLLVVLGLYACSPNPCYVPPAETPAQRELHEHCNAVLDIWGMDSACKHDRIDWQSVPIEPARTPTKTPSANEQAFKREARREYVALQFERTRSPPQ